MNRLPLILSALALVVALTASGAIAAVKINGADIKRGTIPADRLTKNARATLKGQRGPAGADGFDGAPGISGAQGPPGFSGAPGAAGARGGFDPSKVQYVTGPELTIAAGSIGTVLAPCPAGTTVIGGGFFVSIAHPASSQSYGAGWAAIVNNDTLIPINANAYALCAAP